MKTITILTEETTQRGLAAVIPLSGVASVSVRRTGPQTVAYPAETVRSFHSARFAPEYRIDLVVDDDTVDTVIDCVSFAYGAGFFRDAEVLVTAPALAA